jgi:hypothetical protein
LGVVAAYLLYTNLLSGPSGSTSSTPSRAPAAASAPSAAPASGSASGSASQPGAGLNLRRAEPGRTSGRGDEFHPTLRSKRPEDRIDPATIDPTLRLDLLAKVQGVDLAGGSRNVFQFGAPPPPPVSPLKGKEPIVKVARVYGPVEPPPPAKPKPEPPKPPPPPINLKYYGFAVPKGGGAKTAFFLDGEDILVAPEGGTVKHRYKVVRVGVTSVLMEDTVSKSQQSLPLQADLIGD